MFLKDLERLNGIVQARSTSFNEQAKEIGLITYPFRSGFYTVILTKKSGSRLFEIARTSYLCGSNEWWNTPCLM